MDQDITFNPAEWDETIADIPGAHVLQTSEWGGVKSGYGWEPHYCIWIEKDNQLRLVHTLKETKGNVIAAALLLRRSLTLRGLNLSLRILYAPKGPLLVNWAESRYRNQVLDDLASIARQLGAISIKIDPDVRIGTGIPDSEHDQKDSLGQVVQNELSKRGWQFSGEQVQFRNTVLVDLSEPEEVLLARMKQKTRYNIRLAAKRGVVVRTGGLDDLQLLYRMYAETSIRDGFVIREAGYYYLVWRTFMDAGYAEPLIAEVEGNPVAAVIVFRFARKAWYLYGMSREEHREKMPNHLLQWEAMRRAKAMGCTMYDLWGAPDEFNERDPLWGVYRFKEGYGGIVTRNIGAWDLPVNSIMYRIYVQTLPMLLDLMRRRGKAKLRRTFEQ